MKCRWDGELPGERKKRFCGMRTASRCYIEMKYLPDVCENVWGVIFYDKYKEKESNQRSFA